jgi:predicted house-cleaning noncanonical NTP pyrophosphatase (MazG superfamily)
MEDWLAISAYGATVRVHHNKLVRDRIPDIVRAEGRSAVTRVLNEQEYRHALVAKLVEEADEASRASPHELPAELADVFEVLRALVDASGMNWDELVRLADEKRERRGGFAGRIYLDYVEPVG